MTKKHFKPLPVAEKVRLGLRCSKCGSENESTWDDCRKRHCQMPASSSPRDDGRSIINGRVMPTETD